jgi:hypothetical protein
MVVLRSHWMPRPARLEWLIAGKGRQAGREEQQEDAAAEIGRRQEAMADRRPADNRWQGEERQCRRGHELQARRRRERRRRLAGVDAGPAQHLSRKRRRCAGDEAADGVSGQL